MQDNFFETDPQYRKGFKVEEYNGVFSLTSCQQGKDDGIYPEWVIVQGTDRKPRVKDNGQYMVIPMKIVLGKSAAEAITSLKLIIGILENPGAGSNPAQPQTRQPAQYSQQNEPPPFDDSQIPF